MHHTIGYSLLAAGVFIGIIAIAIWGRDQLEKARDRKYRREFDITVAALPAYDGETWEWPADQEGYLPYYEQAGYEFETRWDTRVADWPQAGGATQHFFGTDLVCYDPAADAAEFMRKQKAETTAFIAKITGEQPVAA